MEKIALINYKHFLKEIKEEIQKRRYRAMRSVNRELIGLYWEIGRRIVEKQEKGGWGEAVVEKLANDLSMAFPDTKGFSERNLWNMKLYYLSYRKRLKLQTVSAEISWSNNILILEQTYIFTRYMSVKNPVKTLPAKSRDMLVPFKDHHVLDFLGLGEVYSEEELRKPILANLKVFFLEFGKHFSFIGEEYPLRIGKDTFKIDLLFYHRELRCLVPVELKLGKFKPEFIGKMQFYLGALDEQEKLYHENPSVGLILCKSKNEETIRIAVSQAVRKIGIATYQTKLPDKKLIAKRLHQIQLPEGIRNIENEELLGSDGHAVR